RLPLPEGFWPEAAVVGAGLAILFGLSIQSSIRQKRYATKLISVLSLTLVAALSVGLGFGMQEIFANFISGIMILFERPVRIGDTITIGALSGTVSKIRIRATTITDFDRKDIIVPNKTFITGQLINWSLTDTVTRVTLKLGVDYGS
ncbi:hypothetical protein Pgy4_32981, partial [Pseudomonas savastanoi pv. glycinea str. race 4]